jgi:hypothetical protein
MVGHLRLLLALATHQLRSNDIRPGKQSGLATDLFDASVSDEDIACIQQQGLLVLFTLSQKLCLCTMLVETHGIAQ